jgi:hypothetical protein
LSHIWSHIISLAILTSGAKWPFSVLTPGATWHFSNWFFVCLFHCCTHSLSHYLSLFLILLPAVLPYSPLWCADPFLCQRVWPRSLYFHSVVTWAAIFPAHILIILHISFLPG